MQKKTSKEKNYLFDHLDEEMADLMEEVRLGRKNFRNKKDKRIPWLGFFFVLVLVQVYICLVRCKEKMYNFKN